MSYIRDKMQPKVTEDGTLQGNYFLGTVYHYFKNKIISKLANIHSLIQFNAQNYLQFQVTLDKEGFIMDEIFNQFAKNN